VSALEERVLGEVERLGLPLPVREHQYIPERKWRADFAWPDRMLAVEAEGGSWAGGRHTRGAGFAADCEKYSALTCIGWRIVRVTGPMVSSGWFAIFMRHLFDGEVWVG
jgi:very-short-patch-repair endonuclease